jgi:uncharacterized SAM-binding protein YcdF (DUF218 family)
MMVGPLSRWMGLAGIGVFGLAAFTPLPNLIAARIATAATPLPARKAGAIVVMNGAAYPDGSLKENSLRRAIEGIRLYHLGVAPLLVFSGASTADDVRAALARDLGVPPADIVVDAGPRTTQAEAAILGPRLGGRGVRRIVLVSDSQHLVRALPLFERQGLEVLAAPADDFSGAALSPEDRLILTRRVLQELGARVYNHLLGES